MWIQINLVIISKACALVSLDHTAYGVWFQGSLDIEVYTMAPVSDLLKLWTWEKIPRLGDMVKWESHLFDFGVAVRIRILRRGRMLNSRQRSAFHHSYYPYEEQQHSLCHLIQFQSPEALLITRKVHARTHAHRHARKQLIHSMYYPWENKVRELCPHPQKLRMLQV